MAGRKFFQNDTQGPKDVLDFLKDNGQVAFLHVDTMQEFQTANKDMDFNTMETGKHVWFGVMQ